MIKRIIYLIILVLLSLLLVEKIRNSVADKFLYPVVYRIGLDNKNAEILIASGKIKQYIGKYDEAREVYTYILRHEEFKKQKHAEEMAYYNLGDIFYYKADYLNAAKLYYIVLKKNPINKDALLKFSRINLAYNNLEALIPILEDYTFKRPRDSVGFAELCAVYLEMNNFSAARRNCLTAIKFNRNDARAHYDYSVALRNNDFTRDADKELALAKKIKPNIKSREELREILFKYKKQMEN